MKKKVMSVFFQLAWAALLVISLLYMVVSVAG